MPLVKQEETNVSSPEGGKQSGKKPKTSIVTQSNGGDSGKQDDCSDLTDNNPETDDSTSKSFPQKVSIYQLHCEGLHCCIRPSSDGVVTSAFVYTSVNILHNFSCNVLL